MGLVEFGWVRLGLVGFGCPVQQLSLIWFGFGFDWIGLDELSLFCQVIADNNVIGLDWIGLDVPVSSSYCRQWVLFGLDWIGFLWFCLLARRTRQVGI